MSAIQQILAAIGDSGPHTWWASYANTAYIKGVAVDSNENVYVASLSSYFSGGSYDLLAAKYDVDGVLQWSKILGGAAYDEGTGIALDSSNNVYVCGSGSSQGAGGNDAMITKYNSSGANQWQRVLGTASEDTARGIAVSGTDAYITGTTFVGGIGAVFIAKYNTSGTIQWQRTLVIATYASAGNAIAVDASANVFVVGNTVVSATNAILIVKYNTSGTIQWQRTLNGAGSDIGYGAAVDSSGNVYLTGVTLVGGVASLIVAKYNTSGTLQWQRTLAGASACQGNAISVSGTDVYVVGTTFNSGVEDILIAKYDTSGTLQWQRTLGRSGTVDRGYAVAGSVNGNIYVGGQTYNGATANAILAQLFDTGDQIGSYGVLTYAASTLTDAAGTLTSAGGAMTAAAGAMTAATSTLGETLGAISSTTLPL